MSTAPSACDCTGELCDSDNLAINWGVYKEGTPDAALENVSTPSLDGTSLRCAITGGTPYSNVHCYRNWLVSSEATRFLLCLAFWHPSTTFNNQGGPSIIQALEFTMNKWYKDTRYEFALQWLNVGVGAPQWRYWDPHQEPGEEWVSTGILQELEGDMWHLLEIYGQIINGQIYYERFIIDETSHPLDNIRVAPVISKEEDKLAVAIQLDGNSTEFPYSVYIDDVDFIVEEDNSFLLWTR